MRFLTCFLTVICAVTTFGEPVKRSGRCPRVPSQMDFDLELYAGTWYEIERLPTYHDVGTCGKVDVSLIHSGKADVRFTEIRSDGEEYIAAGVLSVPDPMEPAVFKPDYKSYKYYPEYRIVKTDYTTYSLVTSCKNLGSTHLEFAWIYTRYNMTPTQRTVDRLKRTLRRAGFNTSRFQVVNQDGCEP